MNITIIIPVYNEERSIEDVIKKIKELYPDYEILVVNDGSTDNTADIIKKMGVRLVNHPYNIGNGAAVKTGIRNARGERIVLMDGDGQHNPEDIGRLMKYIPEYDMVIGARKRGSINNLHRDIANKIYNRFASYIARFRIEDLTSGFRIVKRKEILRILYLLPNGFSYPTTSTLAFLKTGKTIKYVPVKVESRRGKSKIRLCSDGPRFLLTIMKIATLFSPFRVFIPVSILSFLLGLGHYSYTFLTQHRFTNMSALLFTTSVIIFMLGLISEQISQLKYSRIHEE